MHQPRVGGIISRANKSCSMVSGGKEIPQKCAETGSSQIGNDNFYYNKEEVSFHLFRMDNIVALPYLMKMGTQKSTEINQHK